MDSDFILHIKTVPFPDARTHNSEVPPIRYPHKKPKKL